MPRVSDLLERFRPAAAPGPAGQIGIPGDRHGSAERELSAVFRAMADTQRQGAAERRAADRAAQARQRDATEQARVLQTQAERDAKVVEAEAAAHIIGAAAAEHTQVITAAQAEAAQLRRQAAQRLPDFVALVCARVRADIAAMPNTSEPHGSGNTGTAAMHDDDQQEASSGGVAEPTDPR
jgi:hypothetical protein